MRPDISRPPRDLPLVDPIEQEFGDVAYMVSHDVAAAFRQMSEFSRLLVRDLGDDLSPKQRRYADRVLGASEHCHAMMEQLLVYSRAQQRVLEPVRQDATRLMRNACLSLGQAIRTAGAEVVIAPLGEVYGDTALLSLAFRHLLSNAITFGRPGVTPRVQITAAATAAAWSMRVSDNGQGVAPEHQDKAFRMFQRLTPAGDHPGVGAGLALCRRIARRHGGDVCFTPKDEGACVELTLPRGLEAHD